MKHKKDLDKVWRELCADLGNDDGINTDQVRRNERRDMEQSQQPRSNRSTLRLCAQVRRAVDLALSADCGDEDLHALRVARVEPCPDARRLRVVLVPAGGYGRAGQPALEAKAAAVTHLLRHAAAQAIQRKKAPRLLIVVEPPRTEGGVTDA